MTAVVNRSRARSAWLTGSAGLLILAVAFVMMVCGAPNVHTPLHGVETQSVTAQCGQLASSGNPARVRACQAGPSTLSAWTRPYAGAMINESWPAIRPAGSSHRPVVKPSS